MKRIANCITFDHYTIISNASMQDHPLTTIAFFAPPNLCFGSFYKALICFVVLTCASASLFAQDSVAVTREKTLAFLRQFRAELNLKAQNNAKFTSLVNSTTNVINITRTVDNLGKIKRIAYYFKRADSLIKNLTASDQIKAAQFIANDLELKLADTIVNNLNLQPYEAFLNVYNVRINATINGKLDRDHRYRLYWRTFFGDSSIDKENWEGNSDNYSSPYYLRITLPGNITFRLRQTGTWTLFRADSYYYRMTREDTVLEIDFSKYIPH